MRSCSATFYMRKVCNIWWLLLEVRLEYVFRPNLNMYGEWEIEVHSQCFDSKMSFAFSRYTLFRSTKPTSWPVLAPMLELLKTVRKLGTSLYETVSVQCVPLRQPKSAWAPLKFVVKDPLTHDITEVFSSRIRRPLQWAPEIRPFMLPDPYCTAVIFLCDYHFLLVKVSLIR